MKIILVVISLIFQVISDMKCPGNYKLQIMETQDLLLSNSTQEKICKDFNQGVVRRIYTTNQGGGFFRYWIQTMLRNGTFIKKTLGAHPITRISTFYTSKNGKCLVLEGIAMKQMYFYLENQTSRVYQRAGTLSIKGIPYQSIQPMQDCQHFILHGKDRESKLQLYYNERDLMSSPQYKYPSFIDSPIYFDYTHTMYWNHRNKTLIKIINNTDIKLDLSQHIEQIYQNFIDLIIVNQTDNNQRIYLITQYNQTYNLFGFYFNGTIIGNKTIGNWSRKYPTGKKLQLIVVKQIIDDWKILWMNNFTQILTPQPIKFRLDLNFIKPNNTQKISVTISGNKLHAYNYKDLMIYRITSNSLEYIFYSRISMISQSILQEKVALSNSIQIILKDKCQCLKQLPGQMHCFQQYHKCDVIYQRDLVPCEQ